MIISIFLIRHMATTKDTAKVTALNIDPDDFSQPPIVWQHDSLPSDAFRILALPSPIDGAVVLCTNIIMYMTQVGIKLCFSLYLP